jgi:hypothetical protein
MIRHIHSSGRYDRSDAAVKKAIGRYVDDANLITLTETQKRDKQTLSQPGWTVAKYYGPGDGDSTVITKDSEWRVLAKWSKQLSQYEQRRGPGGPPPPHSLTVLLQNKHTDRQLLVSIAHLPSHVEGDWFKPGSFRGYAWRVFVWRDAVRTWKRHVKRLAKAHNAKVMMVADWNLNFKRRVFRALVKTLFPMLHLTWQSPFPADGTHHHRVIDATLTNLRVKRKARLYQDDASSDHRPYIETLDW